MLLMTPPWFDGGLANFTKREPGQGFAQERIRRLARACGQSRAWHGSESAAGAMQELGHASRALVFNLLAGSVRIRPRRV
jgi:hypothetical protein